MRIGTKSLLFGCHQFLLHPLFVLVAWFRLYGVPTVGELAAIVVHDWGYWGCLQMESSDGNKHPNWAFDFFRNIGKWKLALLCLYHSRFLAKCYGANPSRLCFADKLGTAMMPWWLWVGLARLTGELDEYLKAKNYEIHEERKDPKRFFLRYRGLVKKLLSQCYAGSQCNLFAARWKCRMIVMTESLNT